MNKIQFTEEEKFHFGVNFETTEQDYAKDVINFFEQNVTEMLKNIPALIYSELGRRSQQFYLLGNIINGLTKEEYETFKTLLILSKYDTFIIKDSIIAPTILIESSEDLVLTRSGIKLMSDASKNTYIKIFSDIFMELEQDCEFRGKSLLDRYGNNIPYCIYETLQEYFNIYILLTTIIRPGDMPNITNNGIMSKIPIINKRYVEFIINTFIYFLLTSDETFNLSKCDKNFVPQLEASVFNLVGYFNTLKKDINATRKSFSKKNMNIFDDYTILIEHSVSKNDNLRKIYKRAILITTLTDR